MGGLMSPSRVGVVQYSYANFCSSLAIPCVGSLGVWMDPLTEASLSTCFASLPLVSALFWPPMQSVLMSRLVALGQSFSVTAFAAAVLAILLNDPSSILPTMLFLIAT